MARKRQAASTASEGQSAYGARTAEVVQMPAALLDLAEDHMIGLNATASRVSKALTRLQILHAVVGGLAVAAHVKSVNPSAVRNTQNLSILLNQDDLHRVGDLLRPLGYRGRKERDRHVFARKGVIFEDAVRIVWAGTKVRKEYPHAAPELPLMPEFIAPDGFVCLGLTRLLTMKLTSYRLKDQVHVQDLLLAGLITKKIERALPKDLLPRLKQVKETTERERLG